MKKNANEDVKKDKLYKGSEIFRSKRKEILNDDQKAKIKGGFIIIDEIDGI